MILRPLSLVVAIAQSLAFVVSFANYVRNLEIPAFRHNWQVFLSPPAFMLAQLAMIVFFTALFVRQKPA